MAYDVNFTLGGLISVTTANKTVAIPQNDYPYSFLNSGGARVYIKLDTASSGIVETEAEKQLFLDPGQGLVVPAGVVYVSVITAGGTATLQMLKGR